jgi:hypothetical protein
MALHLHITCPHRQHNPRSFIQRRDDWAMLITATIFFFSTFIITWGWTNTTIHMEKSKTFCHPYCRYYFFIEYKYLEDKMVLNHRINIAISSSN